MSAFSQSVDLALQLIWQADPALTGIVKRSLGVSASACLLAAGFGLGAGAWLAGTDFPGRRLLIGLLNTLLALPSVVVGLVVYLLLSRSGPLGDWGILFTPTGSREDDLHTVEADEVILGAGALGSTEILLRSREDGCEATDQHEPDGEGGKDTVTRHGRGIRPTPPEIQSGAPSTPPAQLRDPPSCAPAPAVEACAPCSSDRSPPSSAPPSP